MKKEVEEFEQQSKNLNIENRGFVETLKDTNDACGCIIDQWNFNVTIEEMNQVLPVILSILVS